MRRVLAVLAVIGLAGPVLAACADAVPDRRVVAAAKCTLPVSEEFGLDGDRRMYTRDGDVEDLGEGRYRVTGLATTGGPQDDDIVLGTFVCEVVPDSSDTLRGFRVTRLEVQRED